MKPAQIHHFTQKVTIIPPLKENTWHHNPSITQNYISLRHHASSKRDMRSQLAISRRTLPYDWHIIRDRVEDVRLYERDNILYGVGARVTPMSISQVVVRIDPELTSYEILHDYGRPYGRTEKNWSPPSIATPEFDFIYSPTQTVRDGVVRGSHYTGKTHGGSQLLPYRDGWLSIAHRAVSIQGVTPLWYVSYAQLHDSTGFVTSISQFFSFGVGWRPQVQEYVEYVSGALWLTPETLLLSLGVRDEASGLVEVPVSAFEWQPTMSWFSKFRLCPSLYCVVK